MAEVPTPVDLGFTEFVTSLLSEVFDSVVTAQVDQEERFAELIAAAQLPVDDFALQHVSAEAVDAHLATLFPSTDPSRAHDAEAGAPYRAASDSREEEPPFEAVLDVTFRGQETGTDKLNPSGARKVRDAARAQLAAEQQAAVQTLVARGLPRVVVDAGRVSAKLTFEVLRWQEEVEDEDGAGTTPAPDRTLPDRSLGLADRVRLPDVVVAPRLPDVGKVTAVRRTLKDVRLKVHQVDERAPETGRSRSNVYGEVELTFKTVTG